MSAAEIMHFLTTNRPCSHLVQGNKLFPLTYDHQANYINIILSMSLTCVISRSSIEIVTYLHVESLHASKKIIVSHSILLFGLKTKLIIKYKQNF